MVGIRHAPTIDIHVDSPYKDLLLIKGSSYESPSLELKGTVEIRAQDTCSARRLKLRLVGTHKLDFHHMVQQGEQHSMVAVREEKTVFECCWDDLLGSSEGHITRQYPHTGSEHSDRSSPSSSSHHSPSASYTNLFHMGSSTSLSSMASANHAIPHGTHSVPFQIVLPGDIPETIEGLGSGSVLYRLEAVLEKPSSTFKSNVVKHKYIRIMRTMSHDALSMAESMFIGSTWPGKVQYEFSIPSKAVALGATTPVHILLVPLIKGITLGPIKAQVIQQYQLRSARGSSNEQEESFQESQVIVESMMSEHEGTTLMDATKIESEIKIPDYLKLCTPNCDLPNDIVKVRHKIKLQIALKNPDGHTSELRTNLPITLFLSPHHPVHARGVELDKQGKLYFTRESDTLFDTANGDGSGSPRQDGIATTATEDENENLPSYESHVYDQVFTPIGSPMASPMGSLPTSGIATPMPRLQAVSNHIDDYFSIASSQTHSGAASPMLTPQDYTLHLREQLQKLSFERMSQVPSYEEAIHTDTPNSPVLEFSPEYEPDDHYCLGDAQGLTISTRSRRTSSNNFQNHSPTRPSLLSPSPVHSHDNHLHHHSPDDLYHPLPHHLHSYQHPHSPHHLHHPHGPSPLRSVASTTNLQTKNTGTIDHGHSPLSQGKTSASTSNLSKMMGMSKLLKSSQSSVSVKK